MFDEHQQERLRQLYSGRQIGHYRVQCPFCIAGRKNKTDTSLSLEVSANMMLACCHHCGADGIVLSKPIQRTKSRFYDPVILEPKTPTPSGVVKSVKEGLSEEGIAFLNTRGISAETARAAGVVSAVAFFPSLGEATEALAFVHPGPIYKVRSIKTKAHACTGRPDGFYGDIDPAKPLIITEGELDRLACMEAGIGNVVSVPNGASATQTENGMSYLWSAKDALAKVPKVILAVDGDEPGQKLGEELARRIGKDRCWKVVYPDGCKDANDVLLARGKSVLADTISSARPWPVAGLYEATDFKDAVLALYRGAGGQKVSTGYPTLDKLYSASAGLLTVLTGIPGTGKSTFIDQLMMNLSEERGYVHAVCSFENAPPSHIGKLLQMRLGKHFFENQIGRRMGEGDIDRAYEWVTEHFKFIAQPNGESLTIETILENARIAVLRWGVKTLVIDPYNYVGKPKTMTNRHEWVGEILTQARRFAMAYDVHVWFVAHPTKLHDIDGCTKVPKGYDISDSAEWFNKPDFGLTVHRVEGDSLTRVICWKRRFEWLGKEGSCNLIYNQSRHRYFEDGLQPREDDPWDE